MRRQLIQEDFRNLSRKANKLSVNRTGYVQQAY